MSAATIDTTSVVSGFEGLEETNRLKGFLGTAGEMTSIAETLAPHSIAWVKSLSDDELFPLGEKALQDIADDILVLDEIRQRFRRSGFSRQGLCQLEGLRREEQPLQHSHNPASAQ
jgi:hypothetical protein